MSRDDLQDTLLSNADASPPSLNSETPEFTSSSRPGTRSGVGNRQSLFGYNHLLKNKTQATTVWYDELQAPPAKYGKEHDEYQRSRDQEAEKKTKFRHLESAFTPHVFTADERARMDNFESIDYVEPLNLLHAEFLVSDARRQQKRYLKWIIFVSIGLAVGLWAVLLFQSIDWISERKLDMLEYFMGLGWQPPSNPNDVQLTNPPAGSASGGSSAGNIAMSGVSGESSNNHGGMFSVNGTSGSDMSSNIHNSPLNRPITSNGMGGKDLAPGNALVQGYFGYIIWSCFAAVISSMLCVIMPSAAGSGIPDVMAYLNGIMFPRVFNIRTLFVKTLSCILAISSGLPVGAEGPIIHIGALIGAALPTGRSRTFGQKGSSSKNSFLAAFRNSKDQRDFISGGAAAGVTGAFGSPIGGMLFVMEEIATFFPAKLAWMVFFSCLSTITVMHLLNSFFSGWEFRDRSSLGFGNFVDSATVLFETQGGPGSYVPMNLFTLVPSCVVGVIFGLVAIVFTLGNIKGARFRGRVINKTSFRRVMEPFVVIFVFGTLSYVLPLLFNCVTIPPELKSKELQHIRLISSFCKYPETQFNPMATLSLTSSYNVIRLLYTRRTAGLIPWEALVIYQILYTCGAAYSGGMFLSSGMVIPTLLVGAIGGRLVGQIFTYSWSDPGVIALVGSAAFFAGLSRLTFSLIVIMLEISNDLTHIMCLMVAVIIARSIANRACHSLYHLQLEVKCAPFLDDATQQLHRLDTHTAADVIMNNPKEVVSLRSTERIITILEVLSMTKHNAFPVVSLKKKAGARATSTGQPPSGGPGSQAEHHHHENRNGLGAGNGGKFKGLVLRSQLEELLWYLKLRPNGTKSVAHARREDIHTVRDYQFWNRCEGTFPEDLSPEITSLCIDLNPYLDPSAYFVRENMCVSRTYNVFRNLGLRHLVVLDRNHCVTGIITRKNLIGDRLNDALKAADTTMASGTWKTSERPTDEGEENDSSECSKTSASGKQKKEKVPLSANGKRTYGSYSE